MEKKSQAQLFFPLLWLFFSETLSRRCRFSRTRSDPAQKSEQFHAKFAFFLFSRRKNCHCFVTPFSTFANIKGSLPTNSTTPGRLRCRSRPSDEDFSGFWPIIFSNIAKKIKVFLSCPASSGDLHSKRSLYAEFVTGGSVFA